MIVTPSTSAASGGVHGRHEDGADAVVAGQGHHRQDAVGVAQRAVQPQLAQEQAAGVVEDHLLAGPQHAHGHRQVVAGAFLAQVGGRQVDGDPLHGKGAARCS